MGRKAPFDPPRPVSAKYNQVGAQWEGGRHTGIDYPAPDGTPVYAVSSGKVVSAGASPANEPRFGNGVVIASIKPLAAPDEDGEVTTYYVIYAHMSEVKVNTGEMVIAGAELGLASYTGAVIPAGPEGSHLHIEVRQGSVSGPHVDPQSVFTLDSATSQPGASDPDSSESGDDDGDDGDARTSSSPDYVDFGDAAKVKALFDSEFALRKAQTEFNIPMPFAVDGPRRPNPRGFMMPDLMPVTGYALDRGAAAGEEDNRGADDNPSTTDNLYLDWSEQNQQWRKYGFAFHMNPTVLTESSTNVPGVDAIQFATRLAQYTQSGTPIAKASGSQMQLDLFLTRRDDMRVLQLPDWQAQYPTPLGIGPTSWDIARREILTRGTMYDIEYLFRMFNSKPFPVWWRSDGESADWGNFLPRPVLVFVGNQDTARRIRGVVTALTFTHTLYSPGMIPVHTKVSMTIQRLFDTQYRGILWDADQEDADTVNQAQDKDSPSLRERALKALVQGPVTTVIDWLT